MVPKAHEKEKALETFTKRNLELADNFVETLLRVFEVKKS